MKQSSTLRLPADLENVALVIDCATETAQAAGIDDQALYHIQLAVDEACANVVSHAYEGMEPGEMEISCELDEQALTIRVRDWGPGFEPDEIPDPDVEAPLEERTPGGLGLFLIKKVMDQVHYACDPEQGNTLTMTKRLQVAE